MSKTEIETRYPEPPETLRTIYSNHVNILYLPEEVYFDFCTIKIEDAREEEADEEGALKRVPASAHTRAILSRPHALRLAVVLLRTLCPPKQKERLESVLTDIFFSEKEKT